MRTAVFFSLFVFAALSFATLSFAAEERYIPKDFQDRLQRDWLLQDGGANIEKVLNELGENAEPLRKKFQALQTASTAKESDDRQTLYFEVCQERRKQRLEIVRRKMPVIVYAKHQVLGGSHYAYTEAPSDAQHPERRDMLGGQIRLLTVNENGTLDDQLLLEAPKGGTLRDPDVSYDGKKIVFSMRSSYDKDDYHIYDYDTITKTIRQLTFGIGFADVEPCYLPDGNILFCSTRCMQIVDCWWTDVTNMYQCDADGRFLRRVSFDQVHDNYPKVLEDGRIIYTRWDYNDRGQIYPQPLFMMNYDGTGQTEYYGNNSWFPTTILHARGIPNSTKLAAVASGHHTHQRGKLILIERDKGTQENQGVQLIAPKRETVSEKIDAYGQSGDQFQYPLAMDEEHFIVAYTPDGFIGHRYDIPFGLYYMNGDNTERELLAYDPKVSSGQPVPLQQRETPLLRSSPVDYEVPTGRYYVQDVYFGGGLQGIKKGTAKELRIVSLEFRPAGILQNGSGGPAGGALSSTPISINNASWDVKRVLGTVPVEEDGSAYFEVPARTPVYFQLLDERGDVIQSMRSWSTLQPGEMFSCVGCHEEKGSTRNNPLSRGGTMSSLTLRKSPRKPKPVPGVNPELGFSYENIIQPVFDKHCVQCHTGIAGEPEKKTPFSLLGNRFVEKDFNSAGRTFSESYINLTKKGNPNEIVHWLNVQSIPPMLPPYFAGSVKSKLTKMFDNPVEQHKDIKLSEHERRLLSLWIDLLVPYCGSYDEANDWTEAQKAEFAYYQMKRDRMAEIEKENVLKYALWKKEDSVAKPAVESFTQFDSGGIEAKKQFLANYFAAKKNLPFHGIKSGSESPYRNVALNPLDIQGDARSYPHASTNSEYAGMECFSAKNVLNGEKDNKGHGGKFPSWGPNKRTDLFLMVDFGRPVEIDKVVVYIRADFPHDTFWKTGTLKFSDGSAVDFTLQKTAEPQTITFPKRKTNSLTFTNLKQDLPLGWAGFTEVEVWGQDFKEQ